MLLNEAKQKLSGYLGLFSYQLMNLCVKAEPASLLSIEIKEGKLTIGLEKIAEVGLADDYHFVIFPKERNMVAGIVKGIVKAHPEFKYEIKKIDPESSDEDEEADVYLYISMPEVNKERRDFMNDAVDILYNDCKTKCDITYNKYLGEISAKLAVAPEAEKKEGKEQLEQLNDQVKEIMEGYKERKLKEIQGGYESYLQEEEEKQKQQKNEEKAQNKTAGMSMRLFGGEDDE